MSFMICQCPECGKWSTKAVLKFTSATFKCVYCGKTRKMKQSRAGLALNHKGPFSRRVCITQCKALNAMHVQEKWKGEVDEFFTKN